MTDLGQIEMLIGAAYKTNLTRTLELLSRGIDPNSPGKFGRTSLPLPYDMLIKILLMPFELWKH